MHTIEKELIDEIYQNLDALVDKYTLDIDFNQALQFIKGVIFDIEKRSLQFICLSNIRKP